MKKSISWSPGFSFVDDGNGNGNYINQQFPSSFKNDEFDSLVSQFNSTFKWASAASLVSGLVVTVAIVAIVLAIIDCLRKAGSAIPTYARIATSDTDQVPKPSCSSDDVFPVIPDLQLETTTVERFLSDMAKEKPIRFSPQQLAGFTHDYSTKLGSGGFGQVYKGVFPNGLAVAVKVLHNNLDHKIVEEQFMAEVSSLGRTCHINLVRLYGFCFDPTMTALVYEYMENGSLNKFLLGDQNRAIEWEKLQEIAISIAKGLAYLHEECWQRIIHYDIKLDNVLLDASFNAKIADFGLAKLCNRDSSHVVRTKFRGTAGYAAPEMWKPYPVTRKCDVYSFGMLLFEIVCRRRNYEAINGQSDESDESGIWLPRWTWQKFEKNELEEMLSLCGIEERDREKAKRMCTIALWCAQYSVDERPLMSTVVKMLEGGIEITPPPNPFEYLEAAGTNLGLLSGSSGELNSSASIRTSYESFNSIPMQKTLEIEIAI